MRTDDDSWDITTSVGSTALFVAVSRALEAQKPEPLAVDPYAEVFCRAVGGDWADLLDGKAPDHILRSGFGDFFVTYQGARTRYFDTYFAGAVEAGVRQVVVLAAGLDSRAYRLAWAPDTDIYEIDQDQVLEFKRTVLDRHGDHPRARRHEIAVDLRDDWPAALRHAGFDSDAPTAWIAEGLLMYLPASAQAQLFAGIDALSAPGSRVAVEESQPMPAEALAAKRQEEDAAGEDNRYFSLIYNEQHAPAGDYFSERGWTADTTVVGDYLTSVGRPVPGEPLDVRFMADAQSLVSAVKR